MKSLEGKWTLPGWFPLYSAFAYSLQQHVIFISGYYVTPLEDNTYVNTTWMYTFKHLSSATQPGNTANPYCLKCNFLLSRQGDLILEITAYSNIPALLDGLLNDLRSTSHSFQQGEAQGRCKRWFRPERSAGEGWQRAEWLLMTCQWGCQCPPSPWNKNGSVPKQA